MLGLTLALRTAPAGHEVVLYEAADELGGLASAWRIGDVTWDRHYHVTLLSDSAYRNVLREIGLDDSMRWVETRTGFFDGRRLYSISSSVEYLKLPALSLVDKLRVGYTIWHGSRLRDWRTLERTPVEDWLVSLSGRSAFEALWRPLLEAKLGEGWRDTSAAFLWATIQRLYAARRTGLKKEMFGYAPGGYAAVLARFADHLRSLGVSIRLSDPVAAIDREADAGLRVGSRSGEDVFDRVVVTSAPPVAARFTTCLPEAERARLAAVRYQGIVCASLVLSRPLEGYYLTYLTGRKMPFTAIVEMTGLVDAAEVGGRHLVYLPRYVEASDRYFRMSDDEIRAEFLPALRVVHPDVRDEDILAFRVSRVPQVFPVPVLGYSEQVAPRDTSVPGLHLVSSANIVNGTLNVNETVQLAERTASELLRGEPVRSHPRALVGERSEA
ncbi:MAG: NAD(P)/FAD-dependent oxidoreductase [Gemmatimonadetes bacterium]|nr:NAD(P)/FAD-dependent oxidoreductase [Gemmatimonadota bacterium]